MSKTKKNLMYNILYQILIIFIPLVTSPYLSRVLGSEGIGIYSYTYSIANYFVLFSMLGISNYGNRTIAAIRNDKKKLSHEFWNIYLMQIISSLVCLFVYIIYGTFLVSTYKIVTIIETIYVLSALLDISWFYFGMGEFKITVIRNAIIKILTLVFIFLFVKSNQDVWKYALILSCGTLISQSYIWIYLHKYVDFVKPTLKELKKHIKPNLILFIPVISYSIYKIMDKIMLGNLCDIKQVGFYENAEKIINIPQGIITAIGTVMLSKMSNMVANDSKNNVEKYIGISMKYILIIAFAITFGLMSIATEFAPIYFGNEFYVTGSIIKYMSCIVVFISIANVIRTQYLIPYKKDMIYIFSTIVGAIINLVLNAILIPKFGVYGAIIGTICAEFSLMLVQIIGIRKQLNIKKYIKISIPYFVLGVIMFFIICIMKNRLESGILALLIEISCGAFIYVLGTIAILILTKDEIFIKEIKLLKRKIVKVNE